MASESAPSPPVVHHGTNSKHLASLVFTVAVIGVLCVVGYFVGYPYLFAHTQVDPHYTDTRLAYAYTVDGISTWHEVAIETPLIQGTRGPQVDHASIEGTITDIVRAQGITYLLVLHEDATTIYVEEDGQYRALYSEHTELNELTVDAAGTMLAFTRAATGETVVFDTATGTAMTLGVGHGATFFTVGNVPAVAYIVGTRVLAAAIGTTPTHVIYEGTQPFMEGVRLAATQNRIAVPGAESVIVTVRSLEPVETSSAAAFTTMVSVPVAGFFGDIPLALLTGFKNDAGAHFVLLIHEASAEPVLPLRIIIPEGAREPVARLINP